MLLLVDWLPWRIQPLVLWLQLRETQKWIISLTLPCLLTKEEEEDDLNDREVDDEDDEGEQLLQIHNKCTRLMLFFIVDYFCFS